MNFKVTKNTLFAIAVAFVVLSLFITFSQDEFAQQVSMNLLFFKTAPHAILVFVTAAFLTGLFIGLFVAVVDHIQMRKEVKKIKDELTKNFESPKDVTEIAVVEDSN
jgi:uncharacterized integral membrane protein